MEKLPLCRVCLAGNVRMYAVVNNNLRELYEKLTANPFVTEDSRPMLTCFFCCAKLKQCYQFQRKCLESEKLFAQMMNEDYEPNPLINRETSQFSNVFSTSPIELISILGECAPENIAIKEELPAVREGLDDYVEPKKEPQSDELDLENQGNSFIYVEYVPAQHFECDSEDDKPLMEFKIEVEEHEVSRNNQRASDMQRAPVTQKPKLHSRGTKLEDVIKEEQKEYEQSDKTVIQNPQNCSLDVNCRNNSNNEDMKCKIYNKGIDSDNINRHQRLQKKPFKCKERQRCFTGNRKNTNEKCYKCDICQRCLSNKYSLANHIRTHTGEKPYKCEICSHSFTHPSYLTKHMRIHAGGKPFKCDVCQRCFSEKHHLTSHIRTHTGEKPYKCDICQRCFKDQSSLISHIRLHTGEKPFKCEVCHRSFNVKSNLTKHIRIHTGEKRFKCQKCKRCFSEKSNLTSHIRTHFSSVV